MVSRYQRNNLAWAVLNTVLSVANILLDNLAPAFLFALIGFALCCLLLSEMDSEP